MRMLRKAELVGVGMMTLLLHSRFLSICVAKEDKNQMCRPSSCGDMNISYPFRLQGDPSGCGDHDYELICQDNRTMVNLEYTRGNYGKFYVAEINYHSYSFRVVDPGLRKGSCFSTPLYSVDMDYFDPYYERPYSWPYGPLGIPGCNKIVLMNCDESMSTDGHYIPIIPCNTSTITPHSSSSPTYAYAVVGESVNVSDIPYSCTIGENIAIHLSEKAGSEPSNLSMADLQEELLLGLHLSFNRFICRKKCPGRYCGVDFHSNTAECYDSEENWRLLYIPLYFITALYYWVMYTFEGFTQGLHFCDHDYLCYTLMIGSCIVSTIVVGRTILGILCLFAYFIYKFRRRHLSLDDSIEEFLQSQRTLQLIKYSYSEIKKMTQNFKNKLGQGGFGSVYKGKLRSGRIVAVKMLVLSKANGQDFINEVATIGRIHHVNVVKLIGFCIQGSKWALIYDFMANGSLDQFVFPKGENNNPMSWERLYKIALGVGRGIEYLHQGCDMQILHFDIKPHNILLDEDFTPKVSDFGLAKLYSTDESIVSLTAARGTLGYIAPELFYKNIGRVSYKADVYSFGMLLMEMVGRRKNAIAFVEHSSQIYFPSWIYDKYDRGEEMKMGETATSAEKNFVKKMVIVALWCIQMTPVDRPSMSEALEMLEGEVELLEMPPKPSLYSENMSTEDHMSNPLAAPTSSCNFMDTITLDGR